MDLSKRYSWIRKNVVEKDETIRRLSEKAKTPLVRARLRQLSFSMWYGANRDYIPTKQYF